MNKDRESIKLTNSQWRDLVWEGYLEDDEISEIERKYDSSSRHTEHHHLIFQRLSDKKFFRIRYEDSVKDSMGWDECNYGDTKAIEVFPKECIFTIYN